MSNWVPDADADKCMRCRAEFTLFFRRHHCRKCGYVVCATCSPHRMLIEGWSGTQRVCDTCAKPGRDARGRGKQGSFGAEEDLPLKVKSVSPMELFDNLVSGSLMLIDIRSATEFKEKCLPRSINVEVPSSVMEKKERTKEEEADFKKTTIASIEKDLPLQSRMVLRRRRRTDVILITSDGQIDGDSPAWRFAELIRHSKSISNLVGGFNDFVRRYPFVIGASPIPWYPTIVVDSLLYLGSEADARLLKHLEHLEVSHILNVSSVKCFYPNRFEYLKLDLPDEKDTKISKYFDKTYEYIEKVARAKKRVMVHCYQGVSRSATIVIAYLMRKKKWSLKESHNYLKNLRSIVQPNPGFWKQLEKYESKLAVRQGKTLEKKEGDFLTVPEPRIKYFKD